MRAAMVGGAGYVAGKRRGAMAEQQEAQAPPPQAAAPAAPAPSAQSSDTDRIEALTKLKSLLDSGVVTQEQYESERQRLTEGM